MDLGNGPVPIGNQPRGDQFFNDGTVSKLGLIVNELTVPIILDNLQVNSRNQAT